MLTRLSLDTLVECSPLFDASQLEDLAHVRRAQELSLLPARLVDPGGEGIAAPMGDLPSFYFGCLDFMPYRDGTELGFQLMEFNGLSMGGLCALPHPVLGAVLGEVARAGCVPSAADPLVLSPIGFHSRQVHERLLVTQALKEGLIEQYGDGRITLVRDVIADGKVPDGPTVVVGIQRDLRTSLRAEDGRLGLLGRTVDVVRRDSFCQKLVDHFRLPVEGAPFYAVNGVFPVAASKAKTYELYNRFVLGRGRAMLHQPLGHWTVASVDELMALVEVKLGEGLPLVIKPFGRGGGAGVEFLFPSMSRADWSARVDGSVSTAGQFPYVVCEFVDGVTIEEVEHPLRGHRFELRILVYRVGSRLRCFPAVAKVSGRRLDPMNLDRLMLLNSVGVSSNAMGRQRSPFVLPLSNARTLEVLGLTPSMLSELCEAAIEFIAFVMASHREGGLT